MTRAMSTEPAITDELPPIITILDYVVAHDDIYTVEVRRAAAELHDMNVRMQVVDDAYVTRLMTVMPAVVTYRDEVAVEPLPDAVEAAMDAFLESFGRIITDFAVRRAVETRAVELHEREAVVAELLRRLDAPK